MHTLSARCVCSRIQIQTQVNHMQPISYSNAECDFLRFSFFSFYFVIVIRCLFSVVSFCAHSLCGYYWFLLPFCHLNDSFRCFLRIHNFKNGCFIAQQPFAMGETTSMTLRQNERSTRDASSLFQSNMCWIFHCVHTFKSLLNVTHALRDCTQRFYDFLIKLNGQRTIHTDSIFTLILNHHIC